LQGDHQSLPVRRGGHRLEAAATPEYYSDLYEPYTTSSGTTSYMPVTEPEIPETTAEEDITVVKKDKNIFFNAETFFIVTMIIVIAAAVSVPVYIIINLRNKSIRTYEKRYETVNRAMRSQLDPDEMRETARRLNDYIWQLHAVAGCVPKQGELPVEYSARVDDSINASLFSFSDILNYMNREEFGYGMERWQLREEAEYMQTLWYKLFAGMTIIQKFKFRHIKRLI
jgi:hypothetical protein